jgi:hypothetical protein
MPYGRGHFSCGGAVKIPDAEWQLLQAFIGYVDRHIGKHIQSISIIYR